MSTKLTLSLEKEIIQRAKAYAKDQNISLSKLVENYLLSVVSDYGASSIPAGSIVAELSGVITLDDSVDYQAEHTDYLAEKYR
jgi:hypothetical protein